MIHSYVANVPKARNRSQSRCILMYKQWSLVLWQAIMPLSFCFVHKGDCSTLWRMTPNRLSRSSRACHKQIIAKTTKRDSIQLCKSRAGLNLWYRQYENESRTGGLCPDEKNKKELSKCVNEWQQWMDECVICECLSVRAWVVDNAVVVVWSCENFMDYETSRRAESGEQVWRESMA